ncbi:hypothetical protein QP185_12840 [Sphingomonas aerolata]|uniref:hypothetical protein n=1 Tax=Sphingomonas aerolata TaxID=185951 RepID=UPI002FE257BC
MKIGTVWDRTTEVLSGRAGQIAAVALPTLVLPPVVNNALVLLVAPQPAVQLVVGIVSVASALLAILGSLAILALATQPSTDRTEAYRQARARLLPALGVSVVVGLIALVLMAPVFIALIASHFDFAAASASAAASAPAQMPQLPRATAMFVVLYSLALGVLAIWASARLMLLTAVVLNERLGLGAIRRSIALTRGLTWKLIGVLLLFAIVFAIATFAAQAVVGLIFRLILGGDQIPTAMFLAGIAGALASAALMALAYVFTAQLYVATREKPITE